MADQSLLSKTKKMRLPVDTKEDKRYWYALLGFVAATLLSVVYIVLRAYVTGIGFIRGPFVLTWLFGLIILGILTYPARLVDSAYVRNIQSAWQPKMWYWILIGFGLPLGAFTVSWPMFGTTGAVLLAALVFILITASMCGIFLYRRHVYIGAP